MSKSILVISPFYYPNIGGVETHLSDLVEKIISQKKHVFVLTYSPITTPNTKYATFETTKYLTINRYKWFGKNLFHSVEKYPFFDFLYLTPYLFIRSLLWMIANHQKVDIIHSHGINGALIGLVLAKIFHKKHLTSTHAIYENISGLSRQISTIIFNNIDTILCLSTKSKLQLLSWGVNSNNLYLYRYWINLHKFTPARKLPPQFTVLYAGRLIDKKGIPQLLKAAIKLPKVKFLFVGVGPSQLQVIKTAKQYSNIQYLGAIPNNKLPTIYQQSSVFCLPSQYPEGYGRVVMEAVASGLPVLGSNLGSIGEAVDTTVSRLFYPSTKNLITNIQNLYQQKDLYQKIRIACRPYALKHFSDQNYKLISRFY